MAKSFQQDTAGDALETAVSADAVRERARTRLLFLSEDVDEEEVPPTESAERTCIELLAAAAARMPSGYAFPFPHVSTAGAGDISCAWRGEEKTVLLLISPTGAVAIHKMRIRNGRVTSSRVIADPSPDDLREAVRGFVAGY